MELFQQNWVWIISIATIFTVIILVFVPKLQVKLFGIREKKNRFSAKNEARKTIAQIIGGIVLLVGVFLAWKTWQVDKERQITDRCTRVIDQLGHTKLEVRLGGIYALERITKDFPKDHWTIMEALTAYIRENTRLEGNGIWRSHSKDNQMRDEQTIKKTRADIQAILTVIGRREIKYDKENRRLNLEETDLSLYNLLRAKLQRANLSGAHLQWANLQGANLQKANLQGTNLQKANLQGTNLQKANLQWADLQGANLGEANLQGADLQQADLWEADLQWANLQMANLSEANLGEANLQWADFQGANLGEANLQMANLSEANLQGAHLGEANLWWAHLGEANLQGANLQKANLREADLQGANLQKANLREANLQGADFEKADLRESFVTIDQLCKASTLYQVKLHPKSIEAVKDRCPELLEKSEVQPKVQAGN